VHVLIYSFTLPNIAEALIDAKNRGVDVKIVFEKEQISQYSQYFRLASAGVSVRNDTNPDYMHNKVAIIDGVIVMTGSYNWSSSAENSNNENLIIIKSANVAREYETVFYRIWEHGR
jgi:phosphatidylserine/phosphatidylglycerophosphate/cardiolipin synthase-like enzyme